MNLNTFFKSAIIIIITTVFTSFSLAQDSPWFVNISLGQATLEEPSENSAADNARGDYESLFWAVGLGYSINKYIAIEVAYDDLGRFDVVRNICPRDFICFVGEEQFTLSRRGVSVNLLPSWPVSERIDLYGKLGFRQFISTGSGFDREYGDDNEYVFGLGAIYNLRDSVQIYGETQILQDQNVFNVGVRLRF